MDVIYLDVLCLDFDKERFKHNLPSERFIDLTVSTVDSTSFFDVDR